MSGMALQVMGEKAIHAMYPPPTGIHLNDKEELIAYISNLPMSAFVLLLVNYIVCTAVAGAVATLIPPVDTRRPALVVGIIIMLGAIFNAVLMPFQPMWVSALSVLVMVPSALMGYFIARRFRKPDPSSVA